MKYHKAPWSMSLIVISVLVTVICLSVAAYHWPDLVGMRVASLRFWKAFGPLALVAGAALFTIRGYSIGTDAIVVHRLLWATRLPRAGLESARVQPDALTGAIRTCGNGGMFSFSGWFRSPALGSFRAFITDPKRAVVLRYTYRTVVISPEVPEAFVADLSSEGMMPPEPDLTAQGATFNTEHPTPNTQ